MTLPEYDQNPVVFVANLEEVKLEVLKLSIGMYRVLVLEPDLEKKWNHYFKTGLTCLGKIIKYYSLVKRFDFNLIFHSRYFLIMGPPDSM